MRSLINYASLEADTIRHWILPALLVVTVAVWAGELRGSYVCNYCDVANPGDAHTQAFIYDEVNQELNYWGQGDYVKVTNTIDSKTGEWTFTGSTMFTLTNAYDDDGESDDPPEENY